MLAGRRQHTYEANTRTVPRVRHGEEFFDSHGRRIRRDARGSSAEFLRPMAKAFVTVVVRATHESLHLRDEGMCATRKSEPPTCPRVVSGAQQ